MKIYVAGHRGMVGSAIVRALRQQTPEAEVITRTRDELDLLNQQQVFQFLAEERPDYIFIAAAKVGGIHANNTYRAQFIYENLMIESNLIHGAYRADIQSLMFLGSSCIYPRECPQPIKEDYLLTGPLEPTNEPYALAKIAGIKLCENYNHQYGTNYISLMPTNLYGPGDNYDLNNSHVLPALIRKAHEAKQRGDTVLPVWGSGRARREFLYVDDLATACVYFMRKSLAERAQSGASANTAAMVQPLPLINIGSGSDLTIAELAQTVMQVIGFSGQLSFDTSKPDGTPQKLLDVSRAAQLGWKASTPLREGIARAYEDFLARGISA
jgi:GDP-L-fucose synthase